MTHESHWEFFRDGAPANLKFLELLSLQDPGNRVLKATLVKGYAGYAFGVWETLAFEDQLKGMENSLNVKQTIFFYTRSLDYGISYLKELGISSQDLISLSEEKLRAKLKSEVDEEDAEALLYTAQAWGSLINLQKDNVALVSQVPRVALLFDHVCSSYPKIEPDLKICSLFKAQYEASRPRMLGGNPELARTMYQDLIKSNPQHHLIRVSYFQYLLIPGFEKELYGKEATVLRTEFNKWEDMNRDDLENHNEYQKNSAINLYNAVAKKRFEMIEKNKAKIF